MPHEAAGGAQVDVGVCHATRDAHVAHALELGVEAGVAHLVAVALPVVVYVKGQVVTPDVALPDHPTLLFVAAPNDLHIAVPACLDERKGCVCCDFLKRIIDSISEATSSHR